MRQNIDLDVFWAIPTTLDLLMVGVPCSLHGLIALGLGGGPRGEKIFDKGEVGNGEIEGNK